MIKYMYNMSNDKLKLLIALSGLICLALGHWAQSIGH